MIVRYVAFLRAINVGGHVVKMDALRTLFESMRLAGVQTFIASGNVIFSSSASPANLEKKVEAKLQSALGYRVATFIRSVAELNAIAVGEAFAPPELGDGATLFIGFLKNTPPAAAAARLVSLSNPIDTLRVIGREFYWIRRINLGESRLSGASFEKAIGGEATLRNATTVREIASRFQK